jgi:hypothetical protein
VVLSSTAKQSRPKTPASPQHRLICQVCELHDTVSGDLCSRGYCLLVGLDRDAMHAKSTSASSTGTINITGRTIYETAPLRRAGAHRFCDSNSISFVALCKHSDYIRPGKRDLRFSSEKSQILAISFTIPLFELLRRPHCDNPANRRHPFAFEQMSE